MISSVFYKILTILDQKDRPISSNKFNKQIYAHINNINTPNLIYVCPIADDGSLFVDLETDGIYEISIQESSSFYDLNLKNDYFYLNENPTSMKDTKFILYLQKDSLKEHPCRTMHIKKLINYRSRYNCKRTYYFRQNSDPLLTYTNYADNCFSGLTRINDGWFTLYCSFSNKVFSIPFNGTNLIGYDIESDTFIKIFEGLEANSNLYISAFEYVNGDIYCIPYNLRLNNILLIHSNNTTDYIINNIISEYNDLYVSSPLLLPNHTLAFILNGKHIVLYNLENGSYSIEENACDSKNISHMSLGFNGLLYLKKYKDDVVYEYDWISKKIKRFRGLYNASQINFLMDNKIYMATNDSSYMAKQGYMSLDIDNDYFEEIMLYSDLHSSSYYIRSMLLHDSYILGGHGSNIIDNIKNKALSISSGGLDDVVFDQLNGLMYVGRKNNFLVPYEFDQNGFITKYEDFIYDIADGIQLPNGDIYFNGVNKPFHYFRKSNRCLDLNSEALGGYVLDDV